MIFIAILKQSYGEAIYNSVQLSTAIAVRNSSYTSSLGMADTLEIAAARILQDFQRIWYIQMKVSTSYMTYVTKLLSDIDNSVRALRDGT